MRDLDFVSGRFFDYEIPRDKRFLLKYFKHPVQQAFLRYVMLFGGYTNFVDHTGLACNVSLQRRLWTRYEQLCLLHGRLKRQFTEDSLKLMDLIESGRFKLARLPKLVLPDGSESLY